jgi:Tfp pilus assembly protein PilF
MDRTGEAERHYRKAVSINPRDPSAHYRLGNLLLRQGKYDLAVASLEDSLRIDPHFQPSRFALARAYQTRGDARNAVREYRKALAGRPDWPEVQNNLAWILATHPDASVRNATDAVRLASLASGGSHDRDPALLDTLAAAYAEAGDFEAARNTALEALDLAKSPRNRDLAAQISDRLRLYQSGRPFRDNTWRIKTQ